MNIKDFVFCLTKEEAIELMIELQKKYSFDNLSIMTYGEWFDKNIFKVSDTRLRNILKRLLFDFKNRPSFQVLSRGVLRKQRTCGNTTPKVKRIDTTWWNVKRAWKTHSKKPEFFQDLIEMVSDAPRLEMFARRKRDRWDVWGNEVDSDIEL